MRRSTTDQEGVTQKFGQYHSGLPLPHQNAPIKRNTDGTTVSTKTNTKTNTSTGLLLLNQSSQIGPRPARSCLRRRRSMDERSFAIFCCGLGLLLNMLRRDDLPRCRPWPRGGPAARRLGLLCHRSFGPRSPSPFPGRTSISVLPGSPALLSLGNPLPHLASRIPASQDRYKGSSWDRVGENGCVSVF